MYFPSHWDLNTSPISYWEDVTYKDMGLYGFFDLFRDTPLYIGKSVSLSSRLMQHLQFGKNRYSKALHREQRLVAFDNALSEFIDSCYIAVKFVKEQRELAVQEADYINFYRPLHNKVTYSNWRGQ